MRIIRNLVILLVLILAGIWVWARILVAGLPVEPLGSFADIKGERMHYVDQGTGSPILMIHGASGNLGDMELRLAPALRAAGHRVITIDRPGLGLSSRNDPGLNEITAQADMVVALIDELGVEAPTVVGHSLGGAVSLALAVHHPDRVGGLVDLSGVSHPWDGESGGHTCWQGYRGLAGISATRSCRPLGWRSMRPALTARSGQSLRLTIIPT